jgi:hypothetical protein
MIGWKKKRASRERAVVRMMETGDGYKKGDSDV